jgi:hypothetical protein
MAKTSKSPTKPLPILYPSRAVALGRVDNRIMREPNYDAVVFSHQYEQDYFNHYLYLTKQGGFYTSSLVMQIILQIARYEPGMRHATIAIGAMAMASPPNKLQLSESQLETHHYKHALLHYTSGIRVIGKVTVTTENMLKSILACMLFAVFEYMHGNRQMAVSHFTHWDRIMAEYLHQRSVEAGLPIQELPISPLESEVILTFQRLATHPWAYPILHSEANIPGQVKWCCRGRNKYAAYDVPLILANVQEARQWWERVNHFIMHQSPMVTSLQARSASKDIILIRKYNPDEANKLFTVVGDVTFKECMIVINRWHEAFQPAYLAAIRAKTKNITNYLQAVTLEMMYLLLRNDLDVSNESNGKSLHEIKQMFREIIDVSRDVLKSISNDPKGQGIDYGLVWPLCVVTYRCEDAKLWAESSSLLAGYHRQGGNPATLQPPLNMSLANGELG